MNTKNNKAFMLAAATAALFAGGVTGAISAQAEEAKVHCGGVNACKGQSDCATAQNACKGMNACKGKGYKEVTKAECDETGGKVIEQ